MKISSQWLKSCSRKHFSNKLFGLSIVIGLNLLFIPLSLFSYNHKDMLIASAETTSGAYLPFAKRIVPIQHETDENALKVQIIADGKINNFNYFRLSKPPRLEIDISNIKSTVGYQNLLLENPPVKGIRLGAPYKDKAGIVFDLSSIGDPHYKVDSQCNHLIVDFKPASASPTLKPIDNIQLSNTIDIFPKMVRAPSVPAKKTPLIPAIKITSIELETDDQGTKIHIVGDGELTRYDTFNLSFSDPKMLVIDLFGIHSAVGKKSLHFRNPLVKSIRLGTSYKDKVRIVFHLTSAASPSYQIISKNNRLIVFLKRASNLSTTEPPQTPDKVKSTLPQRIIDQETIRDQSDKSQEAIIRESVTSKAEENEEETLRMNKDRIDQELENNIKGKASRFSISIQSGLFLANKVENFQITQNSSSNIHTWDVKGDPVFQGSLVPTFRFSKYFGLDGGLEMILAKDINLKQLALGPKLMFGKSHRFIPYFKACAVYGQLDWSGPPGDFENGIGWQAGIGADFFGGPFKLGLHFTYQDIKFDYNAPGEQQVESNQDSIDFSGYNILAFLKYHF